MKVLHWGRKFEIEILCFLHVLEGADSEKVIFDYWSVCLSETTLQPELKELRTLNFVHGVLIPVGRHDKLIEKIAHAQTVATIELFWF